MILTKEDVARIEWRYENAKDIQTLAQSHEELRRKLEELIRLLGDKYPTSIFHDTLPGK